MKENFSLFCVYDSANNRYLYDCFSAFSDFAVDYFIKLYKEEYKIYTQQDFKKQDNYKIVRINVDAGRRIANGESIEQSIEEHNVNITVSENRKDDAPLTFILKNIYNISGIFIDFFGNQYHLTQAINCIVGRVEKQDLNFDFNI